MGTKPEDPSPHTAGRAGANTPAAIGLVLALLALALDYLSLSNRLYYLGLGAVDNVIPVSASTSDSRIGARLSQPRRVPGLHRGPLVLVLHDRMMRGSSGGPLPGSQSALGGGMERICVGGSGCG